MDKGEAEQKSDWFDQLKENQQQDIIEGLAEAERGETIPHADAVKLFEKWGLKQVNESN